MKKLEVFTFKGKMVFDETLSGEDYSPTRTLSKEQDSRVDFIPLFDDTLVQKVNRFQTAKVLFQKRKEPDSKLLEKTTLAELGEGFTEEEYLNKESDVRRELIQYSGIKETTALVIIDNESEKLLISNLTSQSGVADDIIHPVMDYVTGYEDLTLVAFEAPIIEKMLTSFLLDESKNLPDPLMLVDKACLGVKSEFEKSPKGSTVTVNKEYPADDEVVAFITQRNMVVKELKLDYDGVLEFIINNKCELKGLKFTDHLSFKPDEDTAESVNFMTQYELQLPTAFEMVEKMTKQLEGVQY